MTMLNRILNFFKPNETVPVTYHELAETAVAPEFVGSIRQMKNGKYRLLHNGNEVVATYSRYRDALRGADRRGIYVPNA